MEIESKILGKLEYSEENIIHFEDGLIGIEDKKRFIYIEKEDFLPFSYLQSVEDPNFSLIVINPFYVLKDYKYVITREDFRSVDVKDENDFFIVSIVVFSSKPEDITVNLRAPLIINIHSKKAKQVLLINDDYHIEEPLIRDNSLIDQMREKKEKPE